MNLQAIYHVYRHRWFTYDSPSVGLKLKWRCTCKCGAVFYITRDNTPQWRNPIKRDKTRPSHWKYTEYWPGNWKQ